jgi:hypothetical protein
MEANKKWCSQQIKNDAATAREKGGGRGRGMFPHWGMGFCPRTIYFPIEMVLVIVPPLNNIIHHLHMLI